MASVEGLSGQATGLENKAKVPPPTGLPSSPEGAADTLSKAADVDPSQALRDFSIENRAFNPPTGETFPDPLDRPENSIPGSESPSDRDDDHQALKPDARITDKDKSNLQAEKQDLDVTTQLSQEDKFKQLQEKAEAGLISPLPPDATPDAPWGYDAYGNRNPDPQTLPHDGSAQGLPPQPSQEEQKIIQERNDLELPNTSPALDTGKSDHEEDGHLDRLRAARENGPIMPDHQEDLGPGEAGRKNTEPTEATPPTDTVVDKDSRLQVIEARQQELAEASKTRALTPEETNELKAMAKEKKDLSSDPDARREAAMKKYIEDPDNMTEEDYEALGKTSESGESSEENEEEKLKQEFDNLRGEALEALLNGDPEKAGEAFVEYNKKLADTMGFQLNEDMARTYVESVMKPEKAKSPTETAKMRRIRDELVKLAQLEQQIRNQTEIVKQMRVVEKNLKKEVDQAESDYLNEQDQDQREKKLTIFSSKSMQLVGYQEAIRGQQRLGRTAIVDRRQALGQIHRRLGTKSLMGNIAFGLGTLGHQAWNSLYDESAEVLSAV